MQYWFRMLLVAVLTSVVGACGGSDDPPHKTVVDVAQADGRFTVLVEAAAAADLVGTRSGSGPLTVFAPTDAAFTALLTELTITKALLTKVLTYHVLNSRVLKADVPLATPIATLQGETFTVDSTLAITDKRARKANITATDVLTANGVIHVIDKVILPAP